MAMKSTHMALPSITTLQTTKAINILVLYVVCVVCFVQVPGATETMTSASHNNYRAVTNNLVRLTSDGNAWSATSRIACANLCSMRSSPVCTSFFYNASSGVCVPGSLTRESNGTYEHQASQGAFIYTDSEPCTSPFASTMLGQSVFCLYLNTNYYSYDDALAVCNNVNGHFLALRTRSVLDGINEMLVLEATTLYIWMAINNRNDNNTFRWTDTDAELTETERFDVFDVDQPDFSGGPRTSCGYYNGDSKNLDDSACDEAKQIICIENPTVDT